MADYKLKGLRGEQRRRFLKMMGACVAAVGMDQSRFLNYLADEGGHRLAEAAAPSGQRALGVTCGNGVYAWMQELWMAPDVANNAVANTGGFGGSSAYLYTSQRGYTGPQHVSYTTAEGHEMVYGPHAPWMNGNEPKYKVTALLAGNDETHTEFPESAAIVSSGASLAATVGAIQAQSSTALVPVLGIDPLKYGNAQGAPDVTTAPTAEGLVDLFNSAASKLTLSAAEDRELFETYYKAFLGLRRASNISTWEPELKITKDAARIIGLNFSDSLVPSEAQLQLYGMEGLLAAATDLTNAQRAGLEAFGRTLITVANAFKLGLSNSAMVALSPGPTSEQTFTDPHDTFNNGTNMERGRTTTEYLGKILDGFYTDLENFDDPDSPGETIAERTVFFSWGDTPHTPTRGSNWPDATPEDCNWIYVMDPKGSLKEGWFGSPNMDESVEGWDPSTGELVPGKPATETSTAAGAAVAYAIAKGNMNVVSQYYQGDPIDGVVNG